MSGLRGSIVRFSYVVERVADGVVLCTGETVHVVVGRDMQKRRLPESYAEVFRRAMREGGTETADSDDQNVDAVWQPGS